MSNCENDQSGLYLYKGHLVLLLVLAVMFVACGSDTDQAAENEGVPIESMADTPPVSPQQTSDEIEAEAEAAPLNQSSVPPPSDPEPADPAPLTTTLSGDLQAADDELQSLIEGLDFSAARMQAEALAEAVDDPQQQAHYREESVRLSGFIQDGPALQAQFELLAGNPQQRNQAMMEIFQGGDLARLYMDAVILPEVTVTDSDHELLPIVLELARAVEHRQSFGPSLRRHIRLSPGPLRLALADHLDALLSEDANYHGDLLKAHVLAADPKDVADLLPLVSRHAEHEAFSSASFQSDFRAIIVSAAQAAGEDHANLRGAIFEAAALLGDVEFTEQVTHALGSGAATLAGLPPGWSGSDLGEVPQPGEVAFRNGRFVLRAGGEDYWGSADNGYWVWREVTGDASLRARIHSIQEAHNYTKAGIAFRQNNTADSAHASILASPGQQRDEGYRFVFGSRSRTGGSSDNDGTSKIPLPHWVQLHRRGDEIIAEVSQDGESWEELERMTLDLGDTWYMGLVLSARHDEDMAEAELEVLIEDLF